MHQSRGDYFIRISNRSSELEQQCEVSHALFMLVVGIV